MENFLFNEFVFGYYYCYNEDGSFFNVFGCGNEIVFEWVMVWKFIVESVKYWVEEYYMDGFWFDFMAIYDIEIMNEVMEVFVDIDFSIIVYGEGWIVGDSLFLVFYWVLKVKVVQMLDVAVFSDDIWDGLKGSVFEYEEKGFVSGKFGWEEDVKFGIVVFMAYLQVDY